MAVSDLVIGPINTKHEDLVKLIVLFWTMLVCVDFLFYYTWTCNQSPPQVYNWAMVPIVHL